MGPTWVLSAPDGPHVGPLNIAIRVVIASSCYHLYCSKSLPIPWLGCHIKKKKKNKTMLFKLSSNNFTTSIEDELNSLHLSTLGVTQTSCWQPSVDYWFFRWQGGTNNSFSASLTQQLSHLHMITVLLEDSLVERMGTARWNVLENHRNIFF